ncbi:ecto-NOX disulfide-thiol exchanger 2-like isoform X2 [Chaetodon trifascialis]|uniref:ecto-NOX disulfide-thiol exchanger 2-like isoform X2 n=1 Tax=Chaetodon trifascialis TaxID=109706 RepID=UPI003992B44E
MFLLQYAGLNSLPFDPAIGGDPLHFNSSNGPLVSECPSLENTAENGKKRKRTSLPPDGNHNMTMPSNSMTMPMSDPSAWATAMSNLGIPPISMTGQQLVPDFDPSLGLMTGIAPINPMMPGLGLAPLPLSQDVPLVKEIIHCKSCTLFPPNPNLPLPATRERPPGCRTVFVGGLPENATEQLIMDVFGRCGDIAAIRKSKKNFCHVRFVEELTVDKALLLSGYRIRLGSSTEKKDSGRLHVDFAQARDDLYEWECRQRMLAREERHRRKMEEDRLRPPSPPPIVHYSEHECSELGDRIKDDNTFPESVRVLLTWLERGEVNRRNANNFYSMIQSSNSHIRRLMCEKSQHEKEMEEAKDKFKTAMAAILTQFEQIASVFHAASKQKAWDHFSKAQRKNLDVWRKQAEKIRNVHNEQLMGIRGEEEMEMSDDDLEATNSKDSEDSGVSQAEALKEENDSLRCQLDAYRNEVELLKQEQGKNQPIGSEEGSTHSQQLRFLQQALQGMQKQLLRMRDEMKERDVELERSIEDKQQLKNQIHNLKAGLHNLQTTRTQQDVTASSVVSCSQERQGLPEKNPPSPVHSERDALLVGIISTFLNVHPFGASIEYICSYLQRLDSKIDPGEVEALLSRLPCTFRRELSGVGASLEKRWNFCGFQGLESTS